MFPVCLSGASRLVPRGATLRSLVSKRLESNCAHIMHSLHAATPTEATILRSRLHRKVA